MSSDETKQSSTTPTKKKTQQSQQEAIENADIESINPVLGEPEISSDEQHKILHEDPDDIINREILQQEGEKDFNPDSYGGFNLDHWKRFYGSIQDERQARRAKLSSLTKYNIRINMSDDIFNPRWIIKSYPYHKVTTQAWNVRQKLLAEVDDMQRTADAELIKLQEIQTRVQERRTASATGTSSSPGNGRSGTTNNKRSIESYDSEELNNQQFYDDMDKNIRQSITDKKVEAEWTAARMYLHMSKEDFENCLYEPDLADVIGACDHKQLWGIPKNPTPLVRSPLQEHQAIS